MQTAKKLTRFLKTHFPFSSSYHFLYGILSVFLLYNGFPLEPVLNAHRGLVAIAALISLLPLILVPRFCGKKYSVGGGNWWVLGMFTALLAAACFGWLEIRLALFVIVFGTGGIFLIQRFASAQS